MNTTAFVLIVLLMNLRLLCTLIGLWHSLARLRRVSWRTRLLVLADAAVLVLAALLPVVTGRTTPRWYRLQASRNAVERAGSHGADAWAPEPMRAARAMLQVASVEHRHQELRFFFLRDFTQAEALLRDAEEKAERADKLALARRGSARNTSQEAITRDNVTVKVNAVVFFRVIDPSAAVVQVEDFRRATWNISQTTLRNVIGQSGLDELLAQREKINQTGSRGRVSARPPPPAWRSRRRPH